MGQNQEPDEVQTAALLGVVVRRPADAVQLLAALSLLPTFTVVTHKVLQLLGLFFSDSYAGAVEPVGAKVTADVEPEGGENFTKIHPAYDRSASRAEEASEAYLDSSYGVLQIQYSLVSFL